MYDKVTFKIDTDSKKAKEVVSKLANVKATTEKNGFTRYMGNFKNFFVAINGIEVYLRGSLNKYHFGDNLRNGTREDTMEAILGLSKDLGLDLMKANIVGLELGVNIETEKPVKEYLQNLREMTRRKRKDFGSTLYYLNADKKRVDVIIFYDKLKQISDSGNPIPAEYQGKNILRCEMRFKGRLSQTIQGPKIKGEDLCKADFCNRVVNEMLVRYGSIAKKEQRYKSGMAQNYTEQRLWEAEMIVGEINASVYKRDARNEKLLRKRLKLLSETKNTESQLTQELRGKLISWSYDFKSGGEAPNEAISALEIS